jgi:hypothetical protein
MPIKLIRDKVKQQTQIETAILSTLAFFSLYDLPISAKRLHELLVRFAASQEEIETALEILVLDNKILRVGSLYSLKSWNLQTYQERQAEISRKWEQIDSYFNWLAILPFVRQISVINSLALGTADADSDIDFFVITKKRHLYLVRSMIIVLFRLLGVYKTRQKIKDKFCFGFFVDEDNLNFEHLLIQPSDPYFEFWLANMRPIIGGQQFWQLMQENSWLTDRFPNFKPMIRLSSIKKPGLWIRLFRNILEILLFIPSFILEPILRRIHINHTFKLAENNSTSSTTIANPKMLKLHGYDVRAEVAQAYASLLEK